MAHCSLVTSLVASQSVEAQYLQEPLPGPTGSAARPDPGLGLRSLNSQDRESSTNVISY
jgi:hypothetical protein